MKPHHLHIDLPARRQPATWQPSNRRRPAIFRLRRSLRRLWRRLTS